MLNRNECYSIGKIIKTSGFEGDLMFFFTEKSVIESLEKLTVFFVEMEGFLLPVFPEFFSLTGDDKALVKLQWVDSDEQAKTYVNKALFLDKKQILDKHIPEPSLSNLLGYKVFDHQVGNLGKIKKIISHTVQPLFVVDFKNHEMLIPAIEPIFEKVDHESRIVFISAPEGLIDIYI